MTLSPTLATAGGPPLGEHPHPSLPDSSLSLPLSPPVAQMILLNLTLVTSLLKASNGSPSYA